ncbi:MAG: polymer-forming cytoskeletal protein [Bacteroidales bacterium]|jgi:cytoskeletal protein CcmA (bactofilin family)|nr:polymer-forming cytoskeletal protein [Bacteroidales bacterium]
MGKNIETEALCVNIIAAGTEIQGDIKTSGDMRIDGKLTGNFISEQKLVVGTSGIIEGTITCKDCDISGKIVGNILIKELLILKSTADINGDIAANNIVMELGSQFSGVCKMHQNVFKGKKD